MKNLCYYWDRLLYTFPQSVKILHIEMFLCLTAGIWLDDEGLYICEAKNQFGTIQAEARVTVTGLGMLIGSAPVPFQNTAKPFLILIYCWSHITFSHRAPSLGPDHSSHHCWYRPVPKPPLHAVEWNTSSRKILVSKRKTCKSKLTALVSYKWSFS